MNKLSNTITWHMNVIVIITYCFIYSHWGNFASSFNSPSIAVVYIDIFENWTYASIEIGYDS